MKASPQAYNLIREFEGLRLAAYRCPSGIWTVGYGHTASVAPDAVITQLQANLLLQEDVAQCERTLNRYNLALTQNMYDALISFIFNVGAGNFHRSALLSKIKVNPYDSSISDEFLKWIHSKGKPLAGLQRRRMAEMKLYFSTQ